MRRHKFHHDAGLTLVEVGIAALIVAVLGTIGVNWISAAMSTQAEVIGHSEAADMLRSSREVLDRELRFARAIESGGDAFISVWLDSNIDGLVDAGEIVTWEIESDGRLTRTADDGSTREYARGLVVSASRFYFDTAQPTGASRVTIELVMAIDSGSTQEMRTSVAIRNNG